VAIPDKQSDSVKLGIATLCFNDAQKVFPSFRQRRREDDQA